MASALQRRLHERRLRQRFYSLFEDDALIDEHSYTCNYTHLTWQFPSPNPPNPLRYTKSSTIDNASPSIHTTRKSPPCISSMSLFNPFTRAPKAGAAWFNAGPVSAYPNLASDDGRLAEQKLCDGRYRAGCKVFHVPREDAALATPVAIDEWRDGEGRTKDQVMVFLYQGRFIAVDHVSWTLSTSNLHPNNPSSIFLSNVFTPPSFFPPQTSFPPSPLTFHPP